MKAILDMLDNHSARLGVKQFRNNGCAKTEDQIHGMAVMHVFPNVSFLVPRPPKPKSA